MREGKYGYRFNERTSEQDIMAVPSANVVQRDVPADLQYRR